MPSSSPAWRRCWKPTRKPLIRSTPCSAWTNNQSSCSRRLACRLPRQRSMVGESITNTNATAPPAFSCSPNRSQVSDRQPPGSSGPRKDWAIEVAHLLDTRYAECERVTLVLDNLNTHTKGAFYETFPPDRARAYSKRIEFCYTPKHGSWLKVAECELSCLTSQCLSGRRIGELAELQAEIAAWSAKTNAKQRGVDWQFRIDDARVKLKRLYPKIKT
jgi:hypothetical protein